MHEGQHMYSKLPFGGVHFMTTKKKTEQTATACHRHPAVLRSYSLQGLGTLDYSLHFCFTHPLALALSLSLSLSFSLSLSLSVWLSATWGTA